MLKKAVITGVEKIFTVYSPKGRRATIKNRKWYGLSFTADGQITYIHNGKETVSKSTNAVILPQGKSYMLRGDKTGSFPVINFSCAEKLCDEIVSIPIQNTDEYMKDYEKIRSLFFFEGNSAEVMSVFYHMLYRLSNENSKPENIIRAVKYIEKNYENPSLANPDIARECNISEVHLRGIFKKFYNQTPKKFITDIRINAAKRYLSEGVLKINAVAERCGFTNQYHFCRVFKEKTGLTPTEYMNRHRIYKI